VSCVALKSYVDVRCHNLAGAPVEPPHTASFFEKFAQRLVTALGQPARAIASENERERKLAGAVPEQLDVRSI